MRLPKNVKMIFVFCLVSLVLLGSGPLAWGQATELRSPRSHVSNIFLSGVGGGVLGLSTLSFYGRPHEHLDNISIGFALGLIVGTGVVAYNATLYGDQPPAPETPPYQIALYPTSERWNIGLRFSF